MLIWVSALNENEYSSVGQAETVRHTENTVLMEDLKSVHCKSKHSPLLRVEGERCRNLDILLDLGEICLSNCTYRTIDIDTCNVEI